MRSVIASAIVLLGLASAVDARPRGITTVVGHPTQINLGTVDMIPANWVNVLKAASITYADVSDAGRVDEEGYFVGTAAGDIGMSLGGTSTTYSGIQYKLAWDAGYQFSEWDFANAALTSCTNLVNVTVISGCTGFNAKFGSTGGAGSITFTLSSGGFAGVYIRAGKTASHTLGSKIGLYRVDQEALYLAGVHSTPQHEAFITDLGPATLRNMGWVNKASGNLNSEVKWDYRVKPETFSWNSRQYHPDIWAGPIACVCGGGTDTYTVANPTDGPDIIIGSIANINTGTSPTLNGIPIKTVGAQALLVGAAAGVSYSITAGIGTFVYDAVLNVYLYRSDGMAASVPIEVAIQLANRTGKNLWPNLPTMADDDYITQWGTVVCGTTNGTIYPEYSNEMWLSAWFQTQWAQERGTTLGFGTKNIASWYGLRVREAMGNLLPAVCTGQLSRLKPVLALNAINDNDILPYRMRGQYLAPSGVSTGTGNAAYTTYNGGQNYTTLGQRPVDVVSVIGQAPYLGGGSFCFGPDFGSCSGATFTTLAPTLQAVINAYEAGNDALVISLIDEDVRRGRLAIQTVTCVTTTCSTPAAHGFTINSTRIAFAVTGGTIYSGLDATRVYRVSGTSTTGCPGAVVCNFTMQAYDANGEASGSSVNAGSAGTGTMTVGSSNQRTIQSMGNQFIRWMENTAEAFDADKATLGQPELEVHQYEGNIEVQGPSAAQCLTIGLTTVPVDGTGTACNTKLAAAVALWVSSAEAVVTTQAYFKMFMGTDPAFTPTYQLMLHSKAPSWLVTSCELVYRMVLGCLPTSTPNSYYNGFKAYSRGG